MRSVEDDVEEERRMEIIKHNSFLNSVILQLWNQTEVSTVKLNQGSNEFKLDYNEVKTIIMNIYMTIHNT